MSKPSLYVVKIHVSDGRWLPYGPAFRTTVAAEIWAKRVLLGQDHIVTAAADDDDNDLDDAT